MTAAARCQGSRTAALLACLPLPAAGLLLAGIVPWAMLCAAPAAAQGPPIQTDTPIMLGIQGRGARTLVRVVRKDRLLAGGDRVPDPARRKATTAITAVLVPVNLATTFQVGAAVPLVHRTLDARAGDDSRTGLGDVTLFAKQLLLQVDRRQETIRIAVKGSVKLPSGDNEGALPLGSGSLDAGASVVAGWLRGRWGVYGEAIYFHNTSHGGVDYGDRVSGNAALGFRAVPAVYDRYPSPQLNLYLELSGTRNGHNLVDGAVDPSSGGTQVALAPGIQFVGGRRWLVEASVQVPVSDHPNGTQLGTGWTATGGARILLF